METTMMTLLRGTAAYAETDQECFLYVVVGGFPLPYTFDRLIGLLTVSEFPESSFEGISDNDPALNSHRSEDESGRR